MSVRRSFLFSGIALLLGLAHAPGMVFAQQEAVVAQRAASPPDPRTVGDLPSLAPVIERVSPAVVNISVSGSVRRTGNPLLQDPFFRRFFDMPDMQRDFESAGSGVIVNAREGYILTNHHVVENADRITVTLLDNRSFEAQVVGSDEGSDLAVLQIRADTLTEMALGDSDALRVGDYVLAIGNPFRLSHTVTSGIVSGLGRTGINRTGYEDFIQTDASINPGNSGGALINLRGELVGINSAILSRTGGNIGIGFAIPVKLAQNVMTQLIEHGQVSRGLLGVSITDVTPETAALYGLSETAGALVTQVNPGSAAEQAGLRIEDVIVSINGRTVRDGSALRNAIGLLRPGEGVSVGYIRNGERRTVNAVLGSQEAAMVARESRSDTGRRSPQQLDDVDPSFQGARFGAEAEAAAEVGGVLVADVEADSPAWDRGLRAGDVITNVNRQRVRNVEDVRRIVTDARSVILLVQRGSRGMLLQMR